MEINNQLEAYSEARRQVRREARLYGNVLMCCAFGDLQESMIF